MGSHVNSDYPVVAPFNVPSNRPVAQTQAVRPRHAGRQVWYEKEGKYNNLRSAIG